MSLMSPSISVLLCTRNRPAKLSTAIQSILASSHRDLELIVVDQSSGEESRRNVEAVRDPRLVYIPTTTVGLSRARNIAIRSARAEIVAFTDDDCICDPGWLSEIVAEYERDPKLMGVSGRVIAFGEASASMFCPSLFESLGRSVVDAPVVPQAVLGSGNNMSFRMDVFRRIGLFVESLGAGTTMKSGEDTEFVFRVLHHRMKMLYTPAALVMHDSWMPITQYPVLARAYLLGGTAVLSKFALHLHSVAFVELIRTAYYILRKKKGVGSVPRALAIFMLGCLAGIGYCFASPPKIAATS
jgi:glycosyltransferase involved in cell wall biosynthesis